MARTNEGLFGYYYEFAKAMRALGLDQIRDARGVVHNWRDELAQELAARQKPNGSWTDPEESPERAGCEPMTITSYGLLALDRIPEPGAVNPRRRGRPMSFQKVAW